MFRGYTIYGNNGGKFSLPLTPCIYNSLDEFKYVDDS